MSDSPGTAHLSEPGCSALSSPAVKESLACFLSLISVVTWGRDRANPKPGKALEAGTARGCCGREGGHCHPQPPGAHSSWDNGPRARVRSAAEGAPTQVLAQRRRAGAGTEPCSQAALASGSWWSWAPAGRARGAPGSRRPGCGSSTWPPRASAGTTALSPQTRGKAGAAPCGFSRERSPFLRKAFPLQCHGVVSNFS